MKNTIEQIKDILYKVENYNRKINKIKSILGDDYRDYLKYCMIQGVYNEPIQKSILDKIIVVLGTYYNGWFDEIDLNNNFKFDNKKLIFDYNELKRMLLTSYLQEYGSCYKNGVLDESKYLDLVIKVIETKIFKMYNFNLEANECLNDKSNDSNISKLISEIPSKDRKNVIVKLLKDNTEDIISFQNILYKLISLQENLGYTDMEIKINSLPDNEKTKLDILVSVLKLYIISPEQLEIMNKVFHPDVVSNIIQSMDNYDLIDIYGNTDSKDSKKLVK